MKKLVQIIFISLFTLTINAQSANGLLDKVAAKYRSFQYVKMDFNYQLSNKKANLKQNEKGSIYLNNKKYFLNVMDVKQIYDGKKLYTILDEEQEVNISSEAEGGNVLTPNYIINNFKSAYNSELKEKKNVGGELLQYVKLTPKKSSTTSYILIGVNTKTHIIKKLEEYGKNGTQTFLTITNFVPNKRIFDSYFAFNKRKYADYLINEL